MTSLYTEKAGRLTIPPPLGFIDKHPGKWNPQFKSRKTTERRAGQSCWEGLKAYVQKLQGMSAKLAADIQLAMAMKDPELRASEDPTLKLLLREQHYLTWSIKHYEIVLNSQSERSQSLALKQSAKTAQIVRQNRTALTEARDCIRTLDARTKANRKTSKRNEQAIAQTQGTLTRVQVAIGRQRTETEQLRADVAQLKAAVSDLQKPKTASQPLRRAAQPPPRPGSEDIDDLLEALNNFKTPSINEAPTFVQEY